jgi:catechol 2,3-dioxygenase-like lactoylglutathione lyase family enzyme
MAGLPAWVSLATLGVADVPRARAFYTALGWPVVFADGDDFCVLDTDGVRVALWSTGALAADAGRPGTGPDGVRGSLAVNVASEAEVDAALAAVVAAGGEVTRAAHRADWGGYSGYFADPDGHAWEVAYNPGWPLDGHGRPRIPAS